MKSYQRGGGTDNPQKNQTRLKKADGKPSKSATSKSAHQIALPESESEENTDIFQPIAIPIQDTHADGGKGGSTRSKRAKKPADSTKADPKENVRKKNDVPLVVQMPFRRKILLLVLQ